MDLSLLTKYLQELHERTPTRQLQELTILPLSNVVLIPGTILPLHIADKQHEAMIDGLVASGRDVVICFAPFGRDRRMMMSSICGAGRVIVVDEFRDGRKNIVVEGDYRVEICDFVQHEPYFRAQVRWVPDHLYADPERVPARHTAFLQLVKRWLFLMGHVPAHYFPVLNFFNYPHEVADFVASYFLPDYTLKQKVLETVWQEERVLMIEDILTRGIDWFSKNPAQSHLERRD